MLDVCQHVVVSRIVPAGTRTCKCCRRFSRITGTGKHEELSVASDCRAMYGRPWRIEQCEMHQWTSGPSQFPRGGIACSEPDHTPPALTIEEVKDRVGIGVPCRGIFSGDTRAPFGIRDGHQAPQICVFSRKNCDIDRVYRSQGWLQRSSVVHVSSAVAEEQSQYTGTSRMVLNRCWMPAAGVERLRNNICDGAGNVALVDSYFDWA